MKNYKTLKLTAYFSKTNYEKLRLRGLRNQCASEAWIKRILRDYIANPRRPDAELFQSYWPVTEKPDNNAVRVTSSYPPYLLDVLDHFIETLPSHYGLGRRSRRRMVEVLTLIDLYN